MTSSDDDFQSARESPAPESEYSSLSFNSSPGTAANPINVDNLPPITEATPNLPLNSDANNEIPAPKTCDLRGEKLKWPSLDSAYEALQEFARESGFTVKKSTIKKIHGHPIM